MKIMGNFLISTRADAALPGITCCRLSLFRLFIQKFTALFFLAIPASISSAYGGENSWSIGGYSGQYYDSEPAGLINGRGEFKSQAIVALTASRAVWQFEALPMSLEIDGMIGYQFGLASLYEAAISPVLRWSSFPWKNTVQTDLRFAPLGISYTTMVSPLERGREGKGSNILNLLLVELDFSLPGKKSSEIFVRLHHRCAIYDLLNDYGANGEDFLALGIRKYY